MYRTLIIITAFLGACADELPIPADLDMAPQLPPVFDRGVANPPSGDAGNTPPPSRPPGEACEDNEEICDTFDNDCDGRVDEAGCACVGSNTCFAGPPEARGLGVCTDGTRECDAAGEFFGACEDSIGPSEELCNSLDDDCDGNTDEGCCYNDPACMDAGVGPPPEPVAEGFIVGEQEQTLPVDFVMAIDNSGSMDDTVARVEANLGAFSTRLVEANIDYHFVLVSEKGTNRNDPDVCVPPPMAGPNCADNDRFRHLDEPVGSHSAYRDLLACMFNCQDFGGPGYSDFLRENSLLQVIVVTDDESNSSWDDFQGEMIALGRPDFVLNGVVGLQDRGCVADVGQEYITGAEATDGALLDICSNDWGRVLDVILDSTVVRLQRSFVLGRVPDINSIGVFVFDAGVETPIDGWEYDEASNAIVFTEETAPAAGTQIVVRYLPR